MSQTIEHLEGKVVKYKEKRKACKREIKALRQERLEQEATKANLELNIGDQSVRIQRLEKVRES